MRKIIAVLFLLLFTGLPVSAAQGKNETKVDKIETVGEVVVSATRMETSTQEVGSSVSVVTSEEIASKQASTVAEAVRGVAGLDVVQSGGPGKTTGLFIRGGNSGHLLVLIDGVRVNSPTLGSFDFANLPTDNVEKIEIIRGPQSTLYGSDAMAGVVNIITKKGRNGHHLSLSLEGGSFNTFIEKASLSGAKDKVNYSFSLSREDTDGFSAASEKDGNTEDDGLGKTAASGRVDLQLSDDFNVKLFLRQINAKTDLDDFGSDDPNYTEDSELFVASAAFNYLVTDFWDHTLNLSLTKEDLKFKDPDTSFHNSRVKTAIKGIDWQNDLYLFDESDIVTSGFEYEKQEGKNDSAGFDESLNNKAVYLQNRLSLMGKRINITVGARYDDHSVVGGKATYRLAASYMINDATRIKGSWGTGYKAPTINDLYYRDPWGSRGNSDLKPEESRGYDVGLERQFLDKKIMASATWYFTEFKNLIEWVEYAPWSYEPRNVSRARAKGWELSLEVRPVDSLVFKSAYTILDAKNDESGMELSRRPEKKGSLYLGWHSAKADIGVTANYAGDRWSDAQNTKKIDSYTKIDLSAALDVTDSLNIFARVENLTDEDYEEVKGFGTAGRSYYSGVKLKF